MGGFRLTAQDNIPNGKSINFPTKKYGISIGNSYEFTGIRINFADKNVKRINGLNITFWLKKFQNYGAAVNGISIGVIPNCGSMQPLNIGLLGLGTSQNNMNGISIGGFLIGSGGSINGLCISGLVTMADGDSSVISGIGISGIGLAAEKAVNGIAIGGLAVGSEEEINGIASSLAYLSGGKNFRGIAVTGGYLRSEFLKVCPLPVMPKPFKCHGFSVAIYNRAKELHGIQFGLINYAGNNPKGLRMLPFINLHLRKYQ